MPDGSGLFGSFGDLPLHPLVVHLVVVLLPLSAIALLVIVFKKSWRFPLGWWVLAGLSIGFVASVIAEKSGEALSEVVGLPQEHADLGERLPLASLALVVVTTMWLILARREAGPRALRGILAAVTAILAVIVIALTIVTGHSGAEATWANRVQPKPAAQEVNPDQRTKTTTSPTEQATPATPTTDRSTEAPTDLPAALTRDQVQAHATPADCWSVVEGNVYDLTAWISEHPGGSGVIEGMCGRDATSDFLDMHGGQSRPQNELQAFLIGPLAQ